MTPTWAGLVDWMATVLMHEQSPSVRDGIVSELRRMAEAADRWNAHAQSQRDGADSAQ